MIELIKCYPAAARFMKLKMKSEPAFRPFLEIGRILQPTAQKQTIT
jgi:hypothetical protein